MIKFILGVVVGFVLATVGVAGIARMASNAVPVVDSKVGEAQKFIKKQAE